MSSLGIVILSYDHVDITTKCVQSCLQFSRPILLYHHGSTVTNRHQLVRIFPQIEHAFCDINRGFAAGINRALDIAFAKWERIIFLSNDCELKFLPAKIDFQICVPHLRFPNGRTDAFGGWFDPARGVLRHQKQIPAETTPQGLLFYIPGAAFGISREAWQRAGRFDESLHTYWEDVDWSQKVLPVDIQLDETFVVLHKGKRTTRRNPYYSLYLFHRNRRIVSLRYCPPGQRRMLTLRLHFENTGFALKLISRARFADLKLFLKRT